MKIKEMTKQIVEDQLSEIGITKESEFAPVLDQNKQVLINFFYARVPMEYVAKNKRKVEYMDLQLKTNILDSYENIETLLADIVKPIYKLSNAEFNKTLNLK